MPIQTAIRNYFAALATVTTYSNPSSNGNKYELYVYCLTHDGLSRNFTLTPKALAAGGSFLFKCSPGPINNSYSYFEFTTNKGICELRNGIEIQGHSMYHETDISVLFSGIPWITGNRPTALKLMLALECKFYSNASSLKGESRKYLGAMVDLCRVPLAIPVSNTGIIHIGFSFFRSFVSNVSSASRTDIQTFISDYILFPRFGVVPAATEESNLVDAIERHSRGW
jgi:hypothetical protein